MQMRKISSRGLVCNSSVCNYMNLIQKISQKTGLTQTEIKVNAFLLFVLIGGIIIKSVGWQNSEPNKINNNYAASDSIFYSIDTKKNSKIIQKSDLAGSYTDKSELKNKSININSASLEQLTMIPGIGIKTAENILAYRKSVGRFNSINDLLEVKGIADSKFEKIKKYVYVRRDN